MTRAEEIESIIARLSLEQFPEDAGSLLSRFGDLVVMEEDMAPWVLKITKAKPELRHDALMAIRESLTL